MAGTKKRYEELKQEYKLPDYSQLNKEFEISSIENEEFLLREIRKRIDDRIESFIKILNPILQPESTISDLHECRVFSDEEKDRVFELYKKLMQLHDSAVLLSIEGDDRKDASFIVDVSKEWQGIKEQMIWIVKKIRESWKLDVDIKEELGYLG